MRLDREPPASSKAAPVERTSTLAARRGRSVAATADAQEMRGPRTGAP